jgi:hypothetical protein
LIREYDRTSNIEFGERNADLALEGSAEAVYRGE